LRDLEIYAVEVGGGKRHRAGLFDQILIKENHFALSGLTIRETIQKARREAGPDVVVGAEARNRTEAWAAIDAGAHYVLLDNYTPDMLATEVPILREMMQKKGRRVLLEASGGIGRENIRRFAATGVDRISIGALTHSARAIDLALDVEALSVS
jgi:nicotinate-nucleotide pyrophosphorylase (carboxylating)